MQRAQNPAKRMTSALVVLTYVSCFAALGAAPPSTADVRQSVEGIVAAGTVDLTVVAAIRKLPKNEQPPLAAQLIKSPQAVMRHHAMLILKEFPPAIAAESARTLLQDSDASTRNLAALYLAREAKDPDARALLLKNASDNDPAAAITAIAAIGSLGGNDAEGVLLKLLQDANTPRPILLAVIPAAGNAKALKCAPALLALLDNRELRKMDAMDDVRVCDMAAGAVESIYDMHYVGAVGAYYGAPLAQRDEGIARWKAWYAEYKLNPESSPRLAYLRKTLDEAFRSLGEKPDERTRQMIRDRVQAAFRMTFCLGDLPGVDAVVIPSVKDLWRILQLSDEAQWYQFTNSWHELELGYRRNFLNNPAEAAAAHDQQALAFIHFADRAKNFPKRDVWSLCRNFGEAFPQSSSVGAAKDVQRRIEEELSRDKKQIVLHGHIAVLEPQPPEPPKAGALAPKGNGPLKMVQEGFGALSQKLSDNPSDWSLYRDVVAYYLQRENARIAKGEPESARWPTDRQQFDSQLKLYPGNEWPFLGNAAYQLRVVKKPDNALPWADKALSLNDGNAKACAIRGIIRVTGGMAPDKALADLQRAYELDPKSLGDEPETHAAIAVLIEKALAAKDNARAKEYLKTLGGLAAFGTHQPFNATETCAKLSKAAEGP